MRNDNADFKESCEEVTLNFFLQLHNLCYAGENPEYLPNPFYLPQKVTTLKRRIKSKQKWKPE